MFDPVRTFRLVVLWAAPCMACAGPSDSEPPLSTGQSSDAQGSGSAGSTSGESSAGESGAATTSSDATTAAPSTSSATDDPGSDSSDTGEDPVYGPDGVLQIYPTSPSGAEPWHLGVGDWEARILDEWNYEGTGLDIEVAQDTKVTVRAEATDCEGEPDHGVALSQGYMCSPKDWDEYEVTAYFRVTGPSATEEFEIYGGGGRQTGDGSPDGCLGSSYRGVYLYSSRQIRAEKESWHPHYDFREWQTVDVDVPDLAEDDSAWVGMKVIRYRFESDGVVGIRNEVWFDSGGLVGGEPANEWTKVLVEDDHPDAGSWGTEGTECNAPADDQIMLWGGPYVAWRWADSEVRLRRMSVREIVRPR